MRVGVVLVAVLCGACGEEGGGPSRCGDGRVFEGFEACDDGNTASGDGCRADCRGTEQCGDGLLDLAEVCDDRNLFPGDGCGACVPDGCGDGVPAPGELCYWPRSSFLAGRAPTADPFDQAVNPVTGDFNGDGRVDVAVASRPEFAAPATFTILLGDGRGGLSSPLTFPSSVAISSLVAGDWDADGDTDLAVVLDILGTAQILSSGGDGRVWTTTQVFLSRPVSAIAAADFDGDQDLDLLASAALTPSALLVLTNDGSGVYAEARTIGVGGPPRAVVTGDWNGDGRLDLAAELRGAGIEVLANRGDGGFDRTLLDAADPCPEEEASQLLVIDFEGDADVDLLGICAFRPARVFLNDGAGQFAVSSLEDDGNEAMTAADMDGDGDHDVVGMGPDVQAFIRLSGAPLTLQAWLGAGAAGMTAADIDADGGLDIVAFSGRDLFDAMVTVLYNTNDGTGAVRRRDTVLTSGDPGPPVTADLDGDGDLDVITQERFGDSVRLFFNPGDGDLVDAGSVALGWFPDRFVAGDLDGDGNADLALDLGVVLLGDGAGAFPVTVPVQDGADVAIGDLDGDGDLDLVKAGSFPPTYEILVLRNDGLAGFTPEWLGDSTVSATSTIRLADLDADGDLDALAIGDDLMVLENVGGVLQTALVQFPFQDLGPMAFVDLDGDGRLDLAALPPGGGSELLVFGGTTLDTFGNRPSIALPTPVSTLAVGDLDGDGGPDLAFPTNATDVNVFRPSGLALEVIGHLWAGWGLAEVAIDDLNGDGIHDIVAVNPEADRLVIFRSDP